MRALLSARLNGIRKSDEVGVRVLGCGGVVWRIAARAAAKEVHATLKEVCGPNQFGLMKDGTGRLSETCVAAREVVIVSLDFKEAFTMINRDHVIPAWSDADAT